MQNIYSNTINTPIGYIELTSDEIFLLSVKFRTEFRESNDNLPQILIDAMHQMEEYFNGTRKEFNLKLQPLGTAFQQIIWQLVSNVYFGKTASYLDIALQSGSKNNTRAVGLANGSNPIPIIIPCHRIIGTNGKLTGYAGGLDKKRWLLQHEMRFSDHQNTLFQIGTFSK